MTPNPQIYYPMKKIATIFVIFAFVSACTGLFAQVPAPSRLLPNGFQGPPAMVNPTPDICLRCATPENEPYIPENGEDVTNGGCLAPTELFTDIGLGDTYCGNMNTYMYFGQGYTDLDWYKLVLTQPETIYWSIFSEIDGIAYIISSPCASFGIINADYTNPGIATSISATLPAGTYYLVFQSRYYLGNNVGVQYMAKVSATPPGDPATWCTSPPIPTLSEWGLILLGLALLGFGTIYILKWRGASA